MNTKNNAGRTALIEASLLGNDEIVKTLLDRGADINAKDNLGRSALIWAIKKGHTKIVILLKKREVKEELRTAYWIDKLENKDEKIWATAVNILIDKGKRRECSDAVIESLIEALRDDNEDVRARATYALGEIGEPAVKPLRGKYRTGSTGRS